MILNEHKPLAVMILDQMKTNLSYTDSHIRNSGTADWLNGYKVALADLATTMLLMQNPTHTDAEIESLIEEIVELSYKEKLTA